MKYVARVLDIVLNYEFVYRENKSYKVVRKQKKPNLDKLPQNGTKREKQKQNKNEFSYFFYRLYLLLCLS